MTLTALLVACGGSSKAPTPSGFVITPNIADSSCNGGGGIRVAARIHGDPVVANATLADGSTLVALSPLYPGERFAVLQSVARGCEPNRGFGNGGTATIRIPSRLRPPRSLARAWSNGGLWVTAIAQRAGGGAIVAGSYDGAWVVGEVTRRGRLDLGFGNGGWTVLPFRGTVTAAVEEPSGRLIVGGDNGGGGCCTRNWAAALSAHGRLEPGFGRHGRVELPTGEDSGVDALALERDGAILAKVVYGNMGCWGVGLAMLTPTGRPVAGFADRLARFWRRLGFGAFVGDVYVDGNGFTLVGTGQPRCADGPSFSAPSARGLLVRFDATGKVRDHMVRFPSRLDGSVDVFHHGSDTFVVTWPYADARQLTITARRRDGTVDPRFGSHGRVRIHTPWWGHGAALGTEVSVDRGSPGTIVILATKNERNQLQLIRLRL